MTLTLGNLFNREGVEQVLWNVADQLQKRGDRPWAILVDVLERQGGAVGRISKEMFGQRPGSPRPYSLFFSPIAHKKGCP